MSLFNTETVTCPACGTQKSADVFYSINADRRPDLRAAVIARTFQVETCGKCAEEFRIDPEFNYLDTDRGQWIAVHPLTAAGHWETIVAENQAAFDKSYGPGASEGGRDIGAGLTVRVVFGWAAFREKLATAEAGLDDVELELLKIAILRRQDNAPLSDTVELRLVDAAAGDLILCWLDAVADEVVETMLVPKKAYDDIAADGTGWAALRADLVANAYVDMQRLMT